METEESNKIEEKKQQWESFVKTAKIKTGNHTKMVRFYNALYNFMILSVLLMSGILTCIILLGGIGKMILAALSGACTILIAISKFLIADRKKASHKRFAKQFQNLLIRMMRCETVLEYNKLWLELTEAIIKEPLVLIWHRRVKKTNVTYTMTPGLALAFEGKTGPERSSTSPQQYTSPSQQYTTAPLQGYRPPTNHQQNEFNPYDFHVVSIDDQQRSQQMPNRRDGYVAISGFQEPQTKTPPDPSQEESVLSRKIPEEKTPFFSSPNKSKNKKLKQESEKAFQTRKSSLGHSSQGTLDEIEEENELEEQQNVPEISESVVLTGQRRGRKKKTPNQFRSTPVQDLPPPPPSMEADEDEYTDHDPQQIQTSKFNQSSSRHYSSMSSRNEKSIVYNEEEENELSEDTDDLDEHEDLPYTRN